MNRRELLRNSLLTMGVAALSPYAEARLFATGEDASVELERASWSPVFLNPQQNEALIAISEAIIPATDTPGAKAALVNRFLDLVMSVEPPATQKAFTDALAWFDTTAQEHYKKTFANLPTEQRDDLLNLVAWPHTHARWGTTENGFAGYQHFMVMKRWTVSAFYSSPIGLKEQGWDGWAPRGTFTGCEHQPEEHKASK
jgi:Gluconate 2-dehydrogenase subunit 3